MVCYARPSSAEYRRLCCWSESENRLVAAHDEESCAPRADLADLRDQLVNLTIAISDPNDVMVVMRGKITRYETALEMISHQRAMNGL
ncbi:hypothetical protein ACLOJK_005284 [Asimina triloba]